MQITSGSWRCLLSKRRSCLWRRVRIGTTSDVFSWYARMITLVPSVPYSEYIYYQVVRGIMDAAAILWLSSTSAPTSSNSSQIPVLFFEVADLIEKAEDSGSLYENWAIEYGVVYKVPALLGSWCVILCDPKAIAHFYVRETFLYMNITSSMRLIANMVRSLFYDFATRSFTGNQFSR